MMLSRILIAVIAMVLSIVCLTGCKKGVPEADNEPTDVNQIKTSAEYEAEAKEQIDKSNMLEELEKIEKSIELDSKTTE